MPQSDEEPLIPDHTSTYRGDTLVSESEEHPRRGHRSRHLLAALVVLVLIIAGGVAYLTTLPQRVPANTYVAGIAVGNLTRDRLGATLDSQVRAKLEAPLTLSAGDEVEVTPGDLSIGFDQTATAAKLLGGDSLRERLPMLGRDRTEVTPEFTVDDDATQKALGKALGDVIGDPQNATIELPSPAVELEAQGNASFEPSAVDADVTPGRTGQTVDLGTAEAAVLDAMGAGRATVDIDVVSTDPAITSTALDGVDQLIGSFTTRHGCCQPRVTNIHRIAEIVDGSIVLPGAEFSLNQEAGRRTEANGFVSGGAISEGELVEQIGGGVSQFSTTLFNATWFSGLPTLTHQPHSKYISRYPPGREATLDYDTIDQVFKNDTGTPVVLRTATTDTSVTVALYGHTGDRKVTSTTGARVPRTGGGFSITVSRVVDQDGREASTKTLNWSYTGLD